MGCDVRLLTPRYGFIDPRRLELRKTADTRLALGRHSLQAQFLEHARSGEPPVYFLNCDPLYDRPGVYVDPFSNQDYVDNDYRFIALSKAALKLPQAVKWTPDIFHANDWQSALVTLYAYLARERGEFPAARALMTIHNMSYQGFFPPETLARIDGVERFFHSGGPLEFYGKVNFLKTGICFADGINTVSPTYAKEIQSAYEFGYGLEGVLRARGDLVGILNGIDADTWNPETDPFIVQTYTLGTLDRKEQNKRALCKQMELPYTPGLPLLGVVSRIVSQKGFDVLIHALTDIINLPAQFVLLGAGDPYHEHVLREMSCVFPKRVAVRIGYDEALSHLIEAGADMFLMPSQYEPCGLNQMMSMRYGTLPVVRATGGLTDTVIDADADLESGTGFCFESYTTEEFLNALRRAIAAYENPARWRKLQQNAMRHDFSWGRSARTYAELYERCLQNPPREVA